MKEEQKYSPKYWVGHCKTSDDILKHTMSKQKCNAETKMEEIYSDFWESEDLEVVLIEIRLA